MTLEEANEILEKLHEEYITSCSGIDDEEKEDLYEEAVDSFNILTGGHMCGWCSHNGNCKMQEIHEEENEEVVRCNFHENY